MASNLRVDQIIASTSDSVSIGTATFTGGLSGDITGLNVTGVITATTLNQNVSGILTAQNGVNVTGTSAIGNEQLQLSWSSPNGAIKAKNTVGSPAANLDLYSTDTGGNTNLGIRLQYTGNVGINSTSPARKLDVVDSGASGSVIRSKVTTNNGGYLAYEALNSSGTSVFSVTHNGRINLSENIVFASGQGIDFSATGEGSGTMTSELLDDYEEGTWTPTVTSSGYTQEGSNQFGIYTKIGRLVHISGQFSFSAINTSSDSFAGFLGLPFTVKSGGHQIGVARETETTGAIFVMQVNENTTTFGINSMDGISDNSNLQITTGKNYNFSITYET